MSSVEDSVGPSPTADAPAGAHEVGARRLRKEDARLLTGQTNWTDNIQLPGMLHIAVLRSPIAHARIARIDVDAVLQEPGVLAVFTGADLVGECPTLPCAWPVTEDIVHPNHPPVAVDEVRYVGDAVAVVVARDRYQAADALEAVDVEYEPLEPVVDMEAALAEGAPLVHADQGTNLCYTWQLETGDVDAAFADADVVVRRRIVNQRLIPNAIEPRAVVCVPMPASDEYTLYSATQVPHLLRFLLASVTGIPEHKLRVVAPDVGGGFGSKLQVYPEEAIALLVARRLGRPVKWTESRSENYQASHHGRDHVQHLELAADRDGRIRAVKADILADMGAYLMLITPGIPILGAFMYPGIYKMDAYSFTCRGVFTTKTPTDAYRGAGRPEATYAIERMVDELAVELDMDPIELRRRNWIRNEEFPYETVGTMTYDSGDYEAATTRALELLGYDDLRVEQARRRRRGDRVQLGIGTSTFTEMCGLAPSRILGDLRYGAGGWEAATVRVLPTGKVEVVTGTSPHGQGHVTSWSQIAADALGVDFDDVQVIHGDTQSAPMGLDTYGSRSLVVGGIAVHRAAERVVEKAKKIAAHVLEAAEDDIEFEAGTFRVAGSPEASTTISDLALWVFAAHECPGHLEPDLTGSSVYDPSTFSYPHGTHLCAVEVDTETGSVAIRSYVSVDDVGRVVNPVIVEGQIHGGLAQGIAQALYEHAVYDDAGNLVTGTLVDYFVPGAPDLPSFTSDRTETPSTTNPLGVKGVGEAGTIASTPAVVNAVLDAVRHLGVDDIQMPCSPERVWRALQEGRDRRGIDPSHASQTGGQQ